MSLPRGCYEKSQNTNGMLFLYQPKGTPAALYILYGIVHAHLIQDAEKMQKNAC